jgi:hypothetical protein
MSEQVTVTPKPDANPNTPENQNVSVGLSQLVSIAAAVLAISFFLPWVQFFGASLSGFDIQKLNDEQKLLWAIPVFSALTIFTGMSKRGQRTAAQLAGAIPFCVLIYWLKRMGSDLMHIISFGGYLTLISGAALLILPRRLK